MVPLEERERETAPPPVPGFIEPLAFALRLKVGEGKHGGAEGPNTPRSPSVKGFAVSEASNRPASAGLARKQMSLLAKELRDEAGPDREAVRAKSPQLTIKVPKSRRMYTKDPIRTVTTPEPSVESVKKDKAITDTLPKAITQRKMSTTSGKGSMASTGKSVAEVFSITV